MTNLMPKGSNTALANIAAVRAVLRWRVQPDAPDVDVSALLLGPDGRVRSDEDFVFYNQPRHPTGLVRHRSKTRHGDEVTDTVDVDLAKLPAAIDRVVVGGSVEHGSFDEIPGLHILLFDIAGGPDAEALARFDITDTGGVTALLCGELYRRGGGWKFRAIGQGYSSGLVGLATDFGITVDEDEEQPSAGQTAAPAAGSAAAAEMEAGPPPVQPPAHPPVTVPPLPVQPPTPPGPSQQGPNPQPVQNGQPAPAVQPAPVAQVAPPAAGYGYPPPYQPALLPEPPGFALPLQGPQFQGAGR
jgi:stress response protein SCP2